MIISKVKHSQKED